MENEKPIEFTKNVLNQRNDLTGPDLAKGDFPIQPKHVKIQKTNTGKTQ
ncbi:hypothetical protein [Heyndrickxia oleronia]|nr:hypothetical protein [Heyndrickxia oleronia]GIN41145.1 hypothetical protein J19TS1_40940 [Heyndrickxia oleronia]